jgi:hypothetical protein
MPRLLAGHGVEDDVAWCHGLDEVHVSEASDMDRPAAAVVPPLAQASCGLGSVDGCGASGEVDVAILYGMG